MGYPSGAHLSGYGAANGLESKSDDEIRDANGRQISQPLQKHSFQSDLLPEERQHKGMQAIQFNSHGRGTNSLLDHYTGGRGMSFVSKIKSPSSPSPPAPRWGFSFWGT